MRWQLLRNTGSGDWSSAERWSEVMKLGIIGAGNMGTAILRGYLAGGARPEDVMVSGHHPEKLQAMADELGFAVASSAAEVAQNCDMVLVAVKPKDLSAVLGEIDPAFSSDQILISIAAGKTIADLSAGCPSAEKIIRVMPNTPSMVLEGMSALSRSEKVTDEDYQKVEAIFGGIGRVQEVKENLMDAVTGLSGSGPAFVYMFIEAMASGGVLCGLPAAQALELAAQTVLGSAKMVLETGTHPAALKDAVCSPGGTTIEGVRELEAGGLRSVVMEAVTAACEKSKNM